MEWLHADLGLRLGPGRLAGKLCGAGDVWDLVEALDHVRGVGDPGPHRGLLGRPAGRTSARARDEPVVEDAPPVGGPPTGRPSRVPAGPARARGPAPTPGHAPAASVSGATGDPVWFLILRKPAEVTDWGWSVRSPPGCASPTPTAEAAQGSGLVSGGQSRRPVLVSLAGCDRCAGTCGVGVHVHGRLRTPGSS